MRIGNREYDLAGKTYIMGILNITPDSFYEGNRCDAAERALAKAEKMISEGADIIDVGGMSTKPGHSIISGDEEIRRVVPVVREIRKRFAVPLSIDTYRSEVAEKALDAGADMVNDIWGGLHPDGRMADIIAKYNVPCCLMHNDESDVSSVEEVLAGLKRSIRYACSRGVDISKIIIDPGIGFAKDARTNLRVIKELDRFADMKLPVLLGASRKSLIGYALNLPVEERLEGTLAVTAYALQKTHIAFFRVHDVKENARVIKMIAEIVNA